MIEIIRPNINTGYEISKIPDNEIVIEYLKKQYSHFKIIHINEEVKMKILNCKDFNEFTGNSKDNIVGYNKDKGKSIKSAGGLKLSSDKCYGSYVIEDSRIVFDPTGRFFEERDCYKYSVGFLNTFLTTSTMKDLLMDELKLTREYLLYLGDKVTTQPPRITEEFESVSKDELLSYAEDFEKGKKLYQKIITKE